MAENKKYHFRQILSTLLKEETNFSSAKQSSKLNSRRGIAKKPKNGLILSLTVLGTWNGIKRGVTSRHRTASMIPWKLVEFIWRRKHAGDHWKAILGLNERFTVHIFASLYLS